MKKNRHKKILELIVDQAIETQEELLKALKENGFDVTQATVSRDIKELKLVKSLEASNRYRYVSGQKVLDIIPFDEIFSRSVVSVQHAQNIVVIKCHAGMAMAACAALDGINYSYVIGTLAGDDTIFAVVVDEKMARTLKEELMGFLIKN